MCMSEVLQIGGHAQGVVVFCLHSAVVLAQPRVAHPVLQHGWLHGVQHAVSPSQVVHVDPVTTTPRITSRARRRTSSRHCHSAGSGARSARGRAPVRPPRTAPPPRTTSRHAAAQLVARRQEFMFKLPPSPSKPLGLGRAQQPLPDSRAVSH